jgi:hypothetical protein
MFDAGLPQHRRRETRFDYAFLGRFWLFFAVIATVFCPLTRDPIAFSVGAFLPFVLVRIVGRPNMPVAVLFLLLWEWAQIFARCAQTMADGEALGAGVFGPNVERAYWYMLASVLVLGLTLRLMLGNLRPPTPQDRMWHARWQPRDLVVVYLGSLMLSVVIAFSGLLHGGLQQPATALLHIKAFALFLLFTNVLTTGKGGQYLLVVVLFETVTGFTGVLSDFKAVFIFLALAALAVRIRWTFAMGLGSIVWGTVLVGLALFWTGVKMEYRQVATGSAESQTVTASLGDRLGYLGSRAMNPGAIDWGEASYMLLIRFAYVDIFGSVITVQDTNRNAGFMRQWSEALSHVLQPRVLFPDKAPLSDSDVYVRLAKGDPTEEVRAGTSISVGYMAENYADLGFPGMLFGIMVIGLITGASYRYFMTCRLPWMVREGTVLVLVYSIAQNGVEMSLPKILGAIVMVTAIYVVLAKFAYPRVLAWLDRPVDGRRLAVRPSRA